jgi:hypothetical protein
VIRRSTGRGRLATVLGGLATTLGSLFVSATSASAAPAPPTGWFKLKNFGSGLCIDQPTRVVDGPLTNFGGCDYYGVKAFGFQGSSSDSVQIQSSHSNACIVQSGSAINVVPQLTYCLDYPDQRREMVGFANYNTPFMLKNKFTHLCMASGYVAGSPLFSAYCDGATHPDQWWVLTAA